MGVKEVIGEERVDAFLFHKFSNFTPPPPQALLAALKIDDKCALAYDLLLELLIETERYADAKEVMCSMRLRDIEL